MFAGEGMYPQRGTPDGFLAMLGLSRDDLEVVTTAEPEPDVGPAVVDRSVVDERVAARLVE